jgi:signal peptidase I
VNDTGRSGGTQPTLRGGPELRFLVGSVGLVTATVIVGLWLWAAAPVVLLGWNPVVVTSGSMSPRIQTGDVVIVEPGDGTGLRPGAVILYDAGANGLVTHRIVGIDPEGGYLTQGDANLVADAAAVRPEQVVGAGRLLVPKVGLPSVWLDEGRVPSTLAVGALALVAAWTTRFALLARYDPWITPPLPRGSAPLGVSAAGPPTGVAQGGWSVALWEVAPAADGFGRRALDAVGRRS